MKKTIIASLIAVGALVYCVQKIHYLNNTVDEQASALLTAKQQLETDKKTHKDNLVNLAAKVDEAYNEGVDAQREWAYRVSVGYCLSFHPKHMDDCLALRVGAGDEDGRHKAEQGYKGGIFHEAHFKTRDGAVAAAGKANWAEEHAKPGDNKGELVWEHDYPRIMKVVQTKKGWAFIGKMADLEPAEEVKS